MAGAKTAAQRPKLPKRLRSGTQKKFKTNDVEALKRYQAKMASRASRKLKKKRK